MSTNLSNDFTFFNDGESSEPENLAKYEDQFPSPPAFRFGIVGVGQCGNNMAAAFYRLGYRKVLAINTADGDLKSVKEPVEKLLIARQGAGKDPGVGRTCVESKVTKIRTVMSRMFEGRVDKIVVCMGLGGGTGSGGGPEVVKIAKELVKEWGGNPDRDVIIIATLPEPKIDGPRQCYNALLSYRELEKLGGPRTYVDNTQIRACIASTFGTSWSRMNHWVAVTFHRFNTYAAQASEYGVFDGQDMNDILSRGRFIFSAFRVMTLNEKFQVGDVMNQHLERSLFAKTDLKKAEAAGCIMILNAPAVQDRSPDDLHPAFTELNNMMRPNSTLHRGIYLENVPPPAGGGRPEDLFCYVMLGGLDHPKGTLNALFEKARSFSESEEWGTLSAFLDV